MDSINEDFSEVIEIRYTLGHRYVEEGIYYLIVSCKDNSNNENNKIFEIKVGNTNKEKYFKKEEPQKGCKGNSNPQAITFLAILLTLAMGIKKYEK